MCQDANHLQASAADDLKAKNVDDVSWDTRF
jgi:hypothetical protein